MNMDMDVLPVCMFGYHVPAVPTEPREGIKSPGTGFQPHVSNHAGTRKQTWVL